VIKARRPDEARPATAGLFAFSALWFAFRACTMRFGNPVFRA
jgi:hypothetical protein